MKDYPSFEEPIVKLEQEIQRLTDQNIGSKKIINQIQALKKQATLLTEKIYQKLDAYQILQIARHHKRPYFSDYLDRICSDFIELHGDRQGKDCRAIIGGLAQIDGYKVVVIGHQKGRDTSERLACNFGMPTPYGYRKAKRLLNMADKFGLPVISFIDTPGAYPGIEAEEQNQSHAIAENLKLMCKINVPIISIVIGEGGSGGALAIGLCDELHMLEYAVYSVISPEGCASILWKHAKYASDAANSMHITANQLLQHRLIDSIIREPIGGAHKNYDDMSIKIKDLIVASLVRLKQQPIERLLNDRHKKFMLDTLTY